MIVNEVYIGRIPEIDDIFKCFSELRDNYSQLSSGKKAKKMSELEKKVEDFWGFKAFSIKIYDSQWADASTCPVANSFDLNPESDSLFITTSKGYKFKKEAKAASMAYITTALFKNKNISNEEAFAVFLHEIGHSFVYRSPLVKAQFKTFKNAYISLIIGLALNFHIKTALKDMRLLTNAGKILSAKCQKLKDGIPILRNVSVSDMLKKLNEWVSINMYIINTKAGYTERRLQKEKEYADTTAKKKMKKEGNPYAYDRAIERLSDDFANIYGFGPYLATGLIKMDNSENNPKQIYQMQLDSDFKKIFDKTEALSREIYDVFGDHPGTVDRIYSIMESLEYEIKNNKNLAPKIKDELKSNLNQLKSIINDIKKSTGEIENNKNEYLKALMAKNAKAGNSEDKAEKQFFDRAKIDKDFESRKIDESYNFDLETDLYEFDI